MGLIFTFAIMNWELSEIEHRGEKRIAIKFGFDDVLQNAVRRFSDLKWSKTLGCWHIPDTTDNREVLKMIPADKDSVFEQARAEESMEKGELIVDLKIIS